MGTCILVGLMGPWCKNGRKSLQDLTMQIVFPGTWRAASWYRKTLWIRGWPNWSRRTRKYMLIGPSFSNTWLTWIWMINSKRRRPEFSRTNNIRWVKAAQLDYYWLRTFAHCIHFCFHPAFSNPHPQGATYLMECSCSLLSLCTSILRC